MRQWWRHEVKYMDYEHEEGVEGVSNEFGVRKDSSLQRLRAPMARRCVAPHE